MTRVVGFLSIAFTLTARIVPFKPLIEKWIPDYLLISKLDSLIRYWFNWDLIKHFMLKQNFVDTWWKSVPTDIHPSMCKIWLIEWVAHDWLAFH